MTETLEITVFSCGGCLPATPSTPSARSRKNPRNRRSGPDVPGVATLSPVLQPAPHVPRQGGKLGFSRPEIDAERAVLPAVGAGPAGVGDVERQFTFRQLRQGRVRLSGSCSRRFFVGRIGRGRCRECRKPV